LSLAIGKEGQNTRLAARLTGWRLDIKGMTEWEGIREARLHAAAEAAARAAAEAASARQEAKTTTEDDLTAEPEAVEPMVAAPELVAIAETIEETPAVLETDAEVGEELIAVTAPEDIDEDGVLEALILEEEIQKQTETEGTQVGETADMGISVDDLDAFTLDTMEILDEDEDEEEEGLPLDLGELPVLIPDAGKIRFAEDIVEDIRGGGRRGGGGRSRRGGGGSRRR
jgi:N utilization substance protein A